MAVSVAFLVVRGMMAAFGSFSFEVDAVDSARPKMGNEPLTASLLMVFSTSRDLRGREYLRYPVLLPA